MKRKYHEPAVETSVSSGVDDWKLADYDRRQEGFDEEPLGYQQYGHEPYDDLYISNLKDHRFDENYNEERPWSAT